MRDRQSTYFHNRARNPITPDDVKKLTARSSRNSEDTHAELVENMNTIVFLAYMTKNVSKYKLNADTRARYFYAATWVFITQIVLLSLVYYETVVFPTDYKLEVYSLTVYLAQFMSGLLVHLDLVAHVKESIAKIKYLNNNYQDFNAIGVPLTTCFY